MRSTFLRLTAATAATIALTFGAGLQAVASSSDEPDMGVMAIHCSETTGRGNPGGVPYAYYAQSTCYKDGIGDQYRFRVKFLCSGGSTLYYGPWVTAATTSRTSTGWCPYPRTPGFVSTVIE